MRRPLVLDLSADGIPVAVTCRVLGHSKQAFYKWKANPVSVADVRRAHLTNAAFEMHRDDPESGYRFIADEPNAAGAAVAENTVHTLCRQAGIVSVIHRRRPGKGVGPPVHDDLVECDFTAPGPNRLWLTDITEHPTGEGKVYLCAIKDVWSGRNVGYSISDRMKASLAVTALGNATSQRSVISATIDEPGTVVHSDRRSESQSRKFVTALNVANITGSMGRVGAAGDNAAMESLFALL